MRRLLGLPLMAVVLLAIGASMADACYCGAARYRCCRCACCAPAECCECGQCCCTVMKTCKEVVYEQRQYTCYKTCMSGCASRRRLTA